MPLAAALPAIIGGIGSIGGALIGANASKNAAGQIVDAQGRVISNANSAVQSGQSALQAATGQGQAGVSQAAGAGQAGASDATAQANATLQGATAAQLAQYSPFYQAGAGALPSLQAMAGPNGQLAQQFSFNPQDLSSDPGYQFTLQQGMDAIQRAAASQGGLFSSGTQKSLASYATGSANQYFNDAFNRAAQTFNINRQGALSQISTLQNLAGFGANAASGGANAIGQGASQASSNLQQGGQFGANLGFQGASQAAQLGQSGAQGVANLGIQGAQIVGNALTGQGNAQAAGTIGQANAFAGGLNGVTNNIAALLAGRSASNSGLAMPSGWTPSTVPAGGYLSNYTGGG